jgi:hypothetical protein
MFRALSTIRTSQEDSATAPRTRSTDTLDDKRVSSTAHAATNVNSRSVTSGSFRFHNESRRVTITTTTRITRPSAARMRIVSLIRT